MKPLYGIRNNKLIKGKFITRGTAILEILRSIKTVEIEFSLATIDEEDMENETTKKNNSKKQVTKVLTHKEIKVGWFFDDEKKKLVYYDRFHQDEINRIKELERKYFTHQELLLCKQFKIRPCYVKLIRFEFYKCKLCNLRFKSRSDLWFHERTHGKKKKFKCLVCGKRFLLNKYLQQHANIHTGFKRFHCTLCDRRFKYASSLSNHKRLYHPELPNRIKKLKLEKQEIKKVTRNNESFGVQNNALYKCDECGRIFNRGTALANHKRTHLKTRSYKCRYCSASFKIQYQLDRHIDSRHTERDDKQVKKSIQRKKTKRLQQRK